MCLGLVPISLFPSRFFSCSAGRLGVVELAFMTAPGPDGQGSLAHSFVTCLRFWDLTWPGCPAPDEARRGGVGTQVGSKNKQMQGETQHAREQKN